MITGKYATEEENFTFSTSLWKCSKPIESIDDTYKRVSDAVASVEIIPEKREKFESQFGFPLLGWNEDVEDEQSLRIVSKTIELEKITRDFKLESMRIESGNYLKKSLK